MNYKNQRIKDSFRLNPEKFLRHYLRGEVRNGEFVALNPTRNDRNLGSFIINITNKCGVYCDFATGEKGGDIIALVQYVKGFTYREAVNDLWSLI